MLPLVRESRFPKRSWQLLILSSIFSGALGLNGGIADVGSLYDCLIAIDEGRADDSILDLYSKVRVEKWKTIIDPQSQDTMKFIFSKPEDVIPDHPFYKFCEAMKNNPLEARKNAPVRLVLRNFMYLSLGFVC